MPQQDPSTLSPAAPPSAPTAPHAKPDLPGIISWADLRRVFEKDPGQFYFIAVRWLDATRSENVEEARPMEAVTTGILKDINRSMVSLSQEVFENLGRRDTTSIPRRNVRHTVLFGIIPPFKKVK